MSRDTDQASQPRSPEPSSRTDERAQNLGWGIGWLVAGAILTADQLGWIQGGNWVFPAIVFGLAAHYLHKAFSRR